MSSASSSVWLCLMDMLSEAIGTLGSGNLTETPAQETPFCVSVLGFVPQIRYDKKRTISKWGWGDMCVRRMPGIYRK